MALGGEGPVAAGSGRTTAGHSVLKGAENNVLGAGMYALRTRESSEISVA